MDVAVQNNQEDTYVTNTGAEPLTPDSRPSGIGQTIRKAAQTIALTATCFAGSAALHETANAESRPVKLSPEAAANFEEFRRRSGESGKITDETARPIPYDFGTFGILATAAGVIGSLYLWHRVSRSNSPEIQVVEANDFNSAYKSMLAGEDQTE